MSCGISTIQKIYILTLTLLYQSEKWTLASTERKMLLTTENPQEKNKHG